MEKEIKVEFNALSKSVVEKVSIKYYGDVKEFESSEKYLNDNVLKEVIDLQTKASSHSKIQSILK